MTIHPVMQGWAEQMKQARDARTLSQAIRASTESQRNAKLLNEQHSQDQAARQQGGAA